ncbi:MAG: MMPL family transporter [Bacteroidota bacterium]
MFQTIYRNPKKSILLFVLLTAMLGNGIRFLYQKNSFDGELPTDDPINQNIDAVKEVFGDRSIVMIGLATDNTYTEAAAETIIELTETLKEVPFVLRDEVKSLATLKNVSNRDWGITSDGFLDPIPDSPAAWAQLKQDIADNDLISGSLVSADGQLTVIAAPLDDGFVGGEVYDALLAIKEGYQGEGQLHITGAPILVEDVQRGISGDSRRFIPIAIVLIFIGFYLCFRTLAGVLLPVTMVLMSIIWTMGTMGYLGLPITVVSNALPVIMIAVASSYGIHFMHTLYRFADQHETMDSLVGATLDKIAAPIFITGVTSSLGSLSLLIFKIQSLREFGIIGAFGFAFATFICLFLLPCLCMLIKKPQAKSHTFKNTISQFTMGITKLTLNNRKPIALAYLIIAGLALWQASTINVGDNYMKFFPKSHDGRVAANVFNDKLDGVRVMDVMVDATDFDNIKDEAFFEKIAQFQKEVNQMANVGSVHSYVDLVQHLSANLDSETTESTTLTSDKIAQYLMMHELSATPGEVATLYDENYEKAHLQVFLTSSSPEVHVALYDKIKASFPNYFDNQASIKFGGDVMHRISLGKYIVLGKIQNIMVALIILLLTTWLIFRSLKKGIFTLIPILFSLIMVFGFMGVMGMHLGISTSLLTAMIVGIGIDFSVHYLISFYKYQEQGIESALLTTCDHTGNAISYDAISNVVGFCVLSFSGFLPVQHFGWLLAFSMLLIYLNTLVIFPILFTLRRDTNIDVPLTPSLAK